MIDGYNTGQTIRMITYDDTHIRRAKEYISGSLKTMLYPVGDIAELDRLFNDYLAMSKHSRFESDESCRAIFGCNNRELYEIIKAQLLQVHDNAPEPLVPMTQQSIPEQFLFSESAINPLDYETLELYQPKDFVDGVAKKNALIANAFQPNTDYYWSDFPFFTSVEIIANKAQFDDIPDGYMYVMGNVVAALSYKEWFEGLAAAELGIITESFKKQTANWINEVRMTYHNYSNATNDEDKILYEARLVRLGWNPVMEFNEVNRVRANERFSITIHEMMRYNIVDLSTDLLFENTDELIKPLIKNPLHPIYIVLVEGSSLFSHVTKKLTNGPFSHAAISLTETLDNMYSFNIQGSEGKAGGFSIENIKGYPQDHKLGVFSIFIKQQDYVSIKDKLDYYITNKTDTTYSFLNLLALPFNTVVKMDMSMICSEFVDNLLKLCNINITDKASSLVTPNDFYRASSSNNKIYKIYEGAVKDYRDHKARKIVDRLRLSSKYIKEACILEIKEFPVQFSKDGDLLIADMKKLNYENEYNKAHRLLLSYHKAGNIDGMKYELAKLWFINQLLEKDIYANKKVVSNSNCRSRVLNDFNKYIDVVIASDASFNFTAYYDSTPFSSATTKINGSTLKYTLDFVKQALKPTI